MRRRAPFATEVEALDSDGATTTTELLEAYATTTKVPMPAPTPGKCITEGFICGERSTYVEVCRDVTLCVHPQTVLGNDICCPCSTKIPTESPTKVPTQVPEIQTIPMEAPTKIPTEVPTKLLPLKLQVKEMADKLALQKASRVKTKSTVFEDSTGSIAPANCSTMMHCAKHIATTYHWFRNHVMRGETGIIKIDTTEQLSDVTTKSLPVHQFCNLREKIMIWESHAS
jgi:hypothetical protein